MYGLRFETAAPPLRPDPNRIDVACFIGYVARRPGPLPASVIDALAAQRRREPADAAAADQD